MDPEIRATIQALTDRVESLTSENEALRVSVRDCSDTVGELTTALAQSRAREVAYRKRPPVLHGRTVQTNVGCGALYITLNEDESGRPFEVFFKLGKSGSCQQSYLEALGVAMSVGLRYGADPQKFIEKFAGMRCPNPRMRNADGPQTLSCADGISQGLAKALSIAVALPGFDVPESSASTARSQAEASQNVIDLITSPGGEGGYGTALVGAALAAGIRSGGAGLCPKCSGPLVSRGGCVDCAQACGYVGKCG
jgi:ribonucleoside-diphosphate reductase alpha chain